MLSKNPFRHTQAEVMAAPPSPPLPPLPQSHINASYSQSPVAASQNRRTPPDTSAPPAVPDNFDEDLPPAYTPVPDVSIGEETVGLGPRRPFQVPPPLPSPSRLPPQSRPPPQSSPYSHWSPPSPQPYQLPPTAPSVAPWQTKQQYYRQRQNGGGGLLGALFDTIRDIGEAVSGTQDERMMSLRRANAGAYATPYLNTGTVYAPPPAPIHHASPPRPASTPPSNSTPAVPDDGTPTRTPVPGHPLLRRGNLLVYPRDYLCVKCQNTGYKNYDPGTPCRKCWEKYAKPYTGALAYTPWSSSVNDPHMQRALPKFVPPHLAGSAGSSSSSAYATASSHPFLPPPQHPHHSRSVSQPHCVHAPSQGSSYYVVNPLCPYDGRPPVPDAIAVSPGDPRLGGRLCPRCSGEGIRTVMLIDFETCDICGGTGRVWR